MSGELVVQKAPIAPANDRGLRLASLDDMWRFANYVAESRLAPKGIETPAAILIALQMGAELGLTPMASLQNISIINGRPSVWGDAMLGVCQASGAFDFAAFEETVTAADGVWTATCTVRRFPNGKPIVRTFSMNDAKTAGLQGKTGPWQQYPKRMLQMRARSWALRDAFSDLLRGFKCTEEVSDYQTIDEQPAAKNGRSTLNETLMQPKAITATAAATFTAPPSDAQPESEEQWRESVTGEDDPLGGEVVSEQVLPDEGGEVPLGMDDYRQAIEQAEDVGTELLNIFNDAWNNPTLSEDEKQTVKALCGKRKEAIKAQQGEVAAPAKGKTKQKELG